MTNSPDPVSEPDRFRRITMLVLGAAIAAILPLLVLVLVLNSRAHVAAYPKQVDEAAQAIAEVDKSLTAITNFLNVDTNINDKDTLQIAVNDFRGEVQAANYLNQDQRQQLLAQVSAVETQAQLQKSQAYLMVYRLAQAIHSQVQPLQQLQDLSQALKVAGTDTTQLDLKLSALNSTIATAQDYLNQLLTYLDSDQLPKFRPDLQKLQTTLDSSREKWVELKKVVEEF